MQRLCSQCGETTLPKDAHSCFYKRAWVCSRVCLHAAGDRTCCYGWDCGCTKYSKKRRLLRQHRRQMQDMEDLITLHGLYEQYRRHVTYYFDLHPHPERRSAPREALDEASDAEDPEAKAKEEAAALRQEAADTRAFIEATPSYPENRTLLTELERARMRLEDQYSERMRSATP